MLHSAKLGRKDILVAPDQLHEALASAPVMTSPAEDWRNVVLQHYSSLPRKISVPALRDNMLVCHLAGPFFVEAKIGCALQKRWVIPGQIGVNPSGSAVQRVFRGGPEVVLVNLSTSALADVVSADFDLDPSRVYLLPKLAECDEAAYRLIGILRSEAEHPCLGARLMVEAITNALLVHLLRSHSNIHVRSRPPKVSISPGRLRRVIDYMNEHLDLCLSLDQLAKLGQLSKPQFTRAFRQATGYSPHNFLITLRVKRACQLLKSTRKPVTTIAGQCGFSQHSHFSTAFRQATGMSPRMWRQEHGAVSLGAYSKPS